MLVGFLVGGGGVDGGEAGLVGEEWAHGMSIGMSIVGMKLVVSAKFVLKATVVPWFALGGWTRVGSLRRVLSWLASRTVFVWCFIVNICMHGKFCHSGFVKPCANANPICSSHHHARRVRRP